MVMNYTSTIPLQHMMEKAEEPASSSPPGPSLPVSLKCSTPTLFPLTQNVLFLKSISQPLSNSVSS